MMVQDHTLLAHNDLQLLLPVQGCCLHLSLRCSHLQLQPTDLLLLHHQLHATNE